eukprot:1640194-Prymnesium_polylepis.2
MHNSPDPRSRPGATGARSEKYNSPQRAQRDMNTMECSRLRGAFASREEDRRAAAIPDRGCVVVDPEAHVQVLSAVPDAKLVCPSLPKRPAFVADL